MDSFDYYGMYELSFQFGKDRSVLVEPTTIKDPTCCGKDRGEVDPTELDQYKPRRWGQCEYGVL